MADASVSIDLKLITKSLKSSLGRVKSLISSASPSKAFSGLSSTLSQAQKWTFTLGDAVDHAVNKFYQMKGVIQTLGRTDLHKIADILDDKIYNAVDHTINAFYKMKTAMQQVSAATSSLSGAFAKVKMKDILWRITLQAKGLKESLMNLKIRPGALLSGLASVGKGVVNLTHKLPRLKTVLKGVGTGMSKLGSVLKFVGSKFMGVVSSIKNFIFSLKGLAAAAGVGAAIAGIFKLSGVSEDLERAQWKFDTIFSEIRGKANAAAKEVANAFKVNVGSVQSQMARAADVVKPLGLAQNKILEMTKTIGMLSQGAEAWTEGRYDAERASTALMKALTGEKEMLKEFGVVIEDREIFDYIRAQGKELNRRNFAIAMYNMILQRTPDLQRAAFGRTEEYTGRFRQFKESIKTLSGAIGSFLKPVTTEILNLGAVINRKLAEILGKEEGLVRWRDLSEQIASSIRRISDAIGAIDVSQLSTAWEKVKESLFALGKGVANAYGNAFVALGAKIADVLGDAIRVGFSRGFKSAMEMTPKAFKAIAKDLLKLRLNPAGFALEHGLKGRLTETEKFYKGLEVAKMGDYGFGDIAFEFGDDMRQVLDDALEPLKELPRMDIPEPPRPEFPKEEMPLEGEDTKTSEKNRLALERKNLQIQALLNRRRDLSMKQAERSQASLQGLTAAYTSMLTRAAGKSEPDEKAVRELEMLNKKIELAEKEKALLLRKIEKNTGKQQQAPPPVFR